MVPGHFVDANGSTGSQLGRASPSAAAECRNVHYAEYATDIHEARRLKTAGYILRW